MVPSAYDLGNLFITVTSVSLGGMSEGNLIAKHHGPGAAAGLYLYICELRGRPSGSWQ